MDHYDVILYNQFLFGTLPLLTLLSPDFSPSPLLSQSPQVGGLVGGQSNRDCALRPFQYFSLTPVG